MAVLPSSTRSGERLAGNDLCPAPRPSQRSSRSAAAKPGLTTERQIAYWRRRGLVHPGPTELAQARTVAALRRAGISVARLCAAAERLEATWGREPDGTRLAPFCDSAALPDGSAAGVAGLTRFAVVGGELFIRHPDGAWEGDRNPGQLVLKGVLPLPDDPPAAVCATGSAMPAARRRPRASLAGPDREVIERFLTRENAASRVPLAPL